MPYGREILLRNVKYALRRMDLFHFTENKAFYFTISQEIISHRTKIDISLIKKCFRKHFFIFIHIKLFILKKAIYFFKKRK